MNSFLGHYYHCELCHCRCTCYISTDKQTVRSSNILQSPPCFTNSTIDRTVAEVFLAGWRIITSTYGAAVSEFPARVLFRVEPSDWQDRAGLTTWLFRAILPKTQIEDATRWEQRIASDKTYMFEKVSRYLLGVLRFSGAHHSAGYY